jgi:hypothetical protein
MKTISIFLISCLTAITLWAQTNTVTVKLNTNRYQEVLIDGRTYSIANTTTTNTSGLNGIVTISDLQPGQHTLEVVRVNPNTNARRNNTRTFNLRSRYDLAITVNNDGTIDLKETRNRNYGNARYRTPMTDADFAILLQNVEKQRRASAKTTAVTNAFNNASYYFTTDQASQLLELVTSESTRLSLAKTVYPKITDPASFSMIYDLLESQANRDALQAYVTTYNTNHPAYNSYPGYNNNNNYNPPMTDANFNTLLSNVKRQWVPGGKLSLLTDAFANTSYYFTVAQARQLIQQVSSESSRLPLAKSAYARIVDPANVSLMYDLFSNQAYRDEFASYVSTYNPNNPVYNNGNTNYNHVAMSDADFNTVYNNVKSQWLPGGKMSALTDVFANANYYFTAYQSKQLILLVSDENNRLQLAKSAYAKIVDPANASQLYDLFTSQERKDELRNYINSYKLQ